LRGSLKERSPGVWLLRVYTGQRDPKGNPVQKARTFRGGKRAAEQELARFVTEIAEGRLEDAGVGMTVGALLDRWLKHSERERTPQTIHGHRKKIEHRIKPALGKHRLDKLRASHIDRAMADWLEEGLSPAYVRQLYAILAAALHQAHKWGWVKEIESKKATPPSVHLDPGTVPSPEQLRALIGEAEHRRDGGVLAAAITLAAVTGCRRGELCALRWSNIDLGTGIVTVGRSLGYVNGKGVVQGLTKTHLLRRLTLDEFGLAVVQARIEAQRKAAANAEVELAPDPFLLSRVANGSKPCLPDGLTHGFARVAAKLGMDFHFHQLRHWMATTALAAGHDVRTVAGRLGHADASTTLRVYAHVLEARDRDVAGELGRALAPSAPVLLPSAVGSGAAEEARGQ